MDMRGSRYFRLSLMNVIYDFQIFPHFYLKALLPIGSIMKVRENSLGFICTKPSPAGCRVCFQIPDTRGVKLIFTGGHISLAVAFKQQDCINVTTP